VKARSHGLTLKLDTSPMQTAATSPQQRPTGMWCTRWKRPVAPPRSSRNAAQRMSGRQHDVNEHPELAQFQLRLMAACTVATALNDGREQVGGGGREGIIAVSTRHVRLQTAKDSDADTSRERGIDEISAG